MVQESARDESELLRTRPSVIPEFVGDSDFPIESLYVESDASDPAVILGVEIMGQLGKVEVLLEVGIDMGMNGVGLDLEEVVDVGVMEVGGTGGVEHAEGAMEAAGRVREDVDRDIRLLSAVLDAIAAAITDWWACSRVAEATSTGLFAPISETEEKGDVKLPDEVVDIWDMTFRFDRKLSKYLANSF